MGSVITEAQAMAWGNPDLAGRTVTRVDPDGTIWSINEGEEQAVADFNSDVSAPYLGPDDYTRLAEEWEARPDNALVRIPVYGGTEDGYGLLGYQTPSEYFSQMATDPTVIANEAILEEQRRTLPGESGTIGTHVQVDPVTGTLQVSPGVFPAVQANLDEQARQEMILPGETGVIGTHVQVDPVTGTLQTSPGVFPAVQANLDEQERQEMILPGETGTIGTHQVQVDPVTGTLQTGPGVFPAVQADLDEQARQQMILPGETGTIGTHQVQVDPVTGTLQTGPGVFPAVAAQQQYEGLLSVIRGDLDEPITVEDAAAAIVRMVEASKSGVTLNPYQSEPTSDPAGLDARLVRAERFTNRETR